MPVGAMATLGSLHINALVQVRIIPPAWSPPPIMRFKLSCGVGLSFTALTMFSERAIADDSSTHGESEMRKAALDATGWLDRGEEGATTSH